VSWKTVYRLTPAQQRAIQAIHNSPGKQVEATEFAGVTWDALLRKGLIKECVRLYFGPRSLRYQLTKDGEGYVL
jgi:hypothetical protein